MKREDLTKLGLTDEKVLDQIMALHGQDIEAHKAKITTSQAELDAIKKQLTEAGATIEGFKKLDVEGVKKSADEWKAKAEAAQAESEKQINALKFDHAMEKSLKEFKVKDPVDVIGHIKRDALKLNDDGTILGLKEQLDPLKTSHAHLFESDTPTPKIVAGGTNQSIMTDAVVAAARKGAGLPPAK